MAFAIIDSQNNVLEYPIDLQARFPNVSFPDRIEQTCLPENVIIVQAAPCFPTPYQNATRDVELVDGVWSETWTYSDKTPEEIAIIRDLLGE